MCNGTDKKQRDGTTPIIMKTDDTQLPYYFSPADLSARWQVTTVTLRRWRKLGRLKSSYIGRQVRFSRAEVLRFELEAEA
jgi:hypothetical protein